MPAGDPNAERLEQVRAALAAAGAEGVSGPALARALGCSRAAVHRHVEALRRQGLGIEADGRGYRLAAAQDLVVAALIAPELEPPLAGPILWRPSTGSTNDDLVSMAREGAPEGTVVGADHQRAGRGRRGRSWEAAPGDALLVSVLLRPPVAPVDAGPLTIAVAVALAEALEALGVGPVAVAWPNDVLVGGRKVAGILLELAADQERVSWVVAGVGVNVRSAPALPDARWPPASLAEAGAPPARAELLARFLRALSRRYRGWLAAGPGELLRTFEALDALAGRRVELSLAGETVRGEAAGVDELGRLRLVTPDGERRFASGEVARVLI
jgi:BirA family transcriptional regulator, biotin operon repressor / biotin---[acetyl-CoA-carboxylase] ligase